MKFKLPSLKQWTYAASGENHLNIFPWNCNDLKDKKGVWLANFKIIYQYDVGRIFMNNPNSSDTTKKTEYYVSTSGRASSFESHYKNTTESNSPTLPGNSYKVNPFGLFCMAGNVEELVNEKGFSKGGSWNDPGYYIQNYIYQKYDSTNYVSAERGFRFIMEIVD